MRSRCDRGAERSGVEKNERIPEASKNDRKYQSVL